MSIKKFYILLAFITIIAINYFIANIILNMKKEKVVETNILLDIEINTSENKAQEPKIKKTENRKQSVKYKLKKPLLAFIIDDVSFPNHLRYVDMVNMPLNLSFLPPTSRHKESHLLASDYDKYMVHLPLNAVNYYASEADTLQDYATYEEIDARIKKIRSLFPKAKYINNHTGSKFTSNLKAMMNLAMALHKYNFIFVDSVTTSQSKAKEAFSYKILKRDVFLDNEDDINYIKGQIKEAVERAKVKGYAVAIGHPKFNTLKAIQEMSNYIQTYTKVVYIDEIDNALTPK